MAADYYLNIDTVVGESNTVKDAMEILTFDWGATQPGSSKSGSGLGTGKVNMEDFVFTMPSNKASPQLMLLCATGKHIPAAKLQCRKAGGKQETYLTVDFGDLLISSYKTSGAGGDDSNPTDTISFNYTNIKIEYFEQKPDGSVTSAKKTQFDLKTGLGK
jgi:type VI secretion system secreted protein Hcp